jgi:mannose-6-phosphate isomerase-like protein (cupin superfamily)
MKRNNFLRLCLAAGSVLAAPFLSKAGSGLREKIKKGFKVGAGRDRFDQSISLLEGDTFFTKVSSSDTDGEIYVFESTRLKEGGPFLHYHPDIDEWWYILEGTFLFQLGDETFTAKKGDSIFGPRGIPHAFSKTGKGKAKLLMFYQPAGKMEAFFKAISKDDAKKMSPEERDAFRKEHGIIQVGPPLTRWKKW